MDEKQIQRMEDAADKMLRASLINAVSVVAMSEALGFMSANKFREMCGNSPAYDDAAFFSVAQTLKVKVREIDPAAKLLI